MLTKNNMTVAKTPCFVEFIILLTIKIFIFNLIRDYDTSGSIDQQKSENICSECRLMSRNEDAAK